VRFHIGLPALLCLPAARKGARGANKPGFLCPFSSDLLCIPLTLLYFFPTVVAELYGHD